MQIIRVTLNGKVYKCPSCSKYHIEYKNLNFNLLPEEYSKVVKYFEGFKGEMWEELNSDSIFQRKIVIPTGNRKLNILINSFELKELKKLFSLEPQKKYEHETTTALCEIISEEMKIYS